MSSSTSAERHAFVGSLPDLQHALWAVVFEFAEGMPRPWTLIGGLMTSVLVVKHGGPAPRGVVAAMPRRVPDLGPEGAPMTPSVRLGPRRVEYYDSRRNVEVTLP